MWGWIQYIGGAIVRELCTKQYRVCTYVSLTKATPISQCRITHNSFEWSKGLPYTVTKITYLTPEKCNMYLLHCLSGHRNTTTKQVERKKALKVQSLKAYIAMVQLGERSKWDS